MYQSEFFFYDPQHIPYYLCVCVLCVGLADLNVFFKKELWRRNINLTFRSIMGMTKLLNYYPVRKHRKVRDIKNHNLL